MPYPLVILGAGASNDYIDESKHHPVGFQDTNLLKYKPPLSNGLFNLNQFENEILSKYPEVQKLASDALTIVPSRLSLEDYLLRVIDIDAKKDKRKYRQLIEFMFYLQKLFSVINNEYAKPVNNYKALLEKVMTNCGKAVFVNFNYDLLLEKNIENIAKAQHIDDYIAGDIKVIKLHGASNWVYGPFSVRGPTPNLTALDYFLENAESTFTGDKSKNKLSILLSERYEVDINESLKEVYLPAVAIPVRQKDHFVCPSSHLDRLEQCLGEIDRVLIIGWKAADNTFLQFLKDKLKTNLPVFVVTHSTSVGDINENLKELPLLDIKVFAEHGFTQFINSGKCEEFLTTKFN